MLTVVERSGIGRVDKPLEITRGLSCRQPWAWNGLCFAVPFHETSREGLRDVVNNLLPSAINSLTWTRDSLGNTSANLGATDSFIDWPDHPRHDRPTTEFTAAVRLKKLGGADFDGGVFVNRYNPGVDPWNTWAISQPGSGTGIAASMATPTFQTTANTGAIPTTEYVTMLTRWRSGSTQSCDVFGERGNLLLSVTSAGSITGTLTYGAGFGIRLNAGDTGDIGAPHLTANYNGHYSQALLWSRRLSDVELSAFIADPFGWYSPRRETVVMAGPFPVSAGLPGDINYQPVRPLRRGGLL